MILGLLLCLCLLGNVFLHGNCANCSSRQIVNGEEGSISDGPKDYIPSSNCEWLIDGGGPNRTINLTFDVFATECSFDFLFIYDGNSYNSKLIATLSGDSKPREVTAFSGFMLLHFFSDRNYEKKGFKAHYQIYQCPWDCSHRGRCENNSCICEPGYSGVGCQVTDCPNDCSGNGLCLFHSYKLQYCNCSAGYIGADCGLKLSRPEDQGVWYNVHREEGRELSARTSHTAIFLDDCIWVFAGFDLNTVRNDLWRYCTPTNRWEQIVRFEGEFEDEYDGGTSAASWPEARCEHAAAVFRDGFYIFGGTLDNGSYGDDLWYFNVTSLAWKRAVTNESDFQLRVTGHTLTTVEDHLYLVGGKLEDRVFLGSLHRISAVHPTRWEKVMAKGGYYPPHHLVGHSTVYHKESRSLYVFGGYSKRSAIVSERTHNIQAFNVDDLFWAHLYNEDWQSESIPRQRVYHSAVVMGNYLVVYGGNTHEHSELEICYNNEIFFYHLGCHVWVNHTHFTGDEIPAKGRFGHAAVVANGNIMFIVGGYSGQVLGDLVAYKAPVAVADHQCTPKTASHLATTTTALSDESHCEMYTNSTVCQADPECVFCNKGRNDSSLKHCVHRDSAELCNDGDYVNGTDNCPGICPSLHTCRACVSQGGGVNLTSAAPFRRIHIKQCSWCVKEARCQTRSEPHRTCKSPDQTASGMEGWWGGLSASLTTMHQCLKEDFPAGLHWIKYHYPINASFPDELSFIRQTKETKRLASTSNYTYEFRGFIHPLNASSASGEDLMLMMTLANAKALLYLSSDETPQKKEVVANMTEMNILRSSTAKRLSGLPVFPNALRGNKYYVEQVVSQVLQAGNVNGTNVVKAVMRLVWNGGVNPSLKQHAFTSEFLEPFSGGRCASSHNCLQCLTDVACSWCEVTHSCVPRNLTSDVCRSDEEHQYLITSPVECPSCHNYVQCTTCASDPLCEWVTPKGHCRRRHRDSKAYKSSSECPLACHLRKNCSDCIEIQWECTWCKNTQTCLPLSDYVSRYFYGQCRSWLDGESIHQDCRTCYNHTSCGQCLKEFGCGWCSNDNSPQLGLCLPGDFTGIYGSHTCSQLLIESHNLSVPEPASWSYDQCPDVEECVLGLHNCHSNATCVNTRLAYHCECNRGFEGDGFHRCNETCYYDCVYGECSGAPDFVCGCDLGWTGDSCDVDCGCNNHSFCSKGVGVCDRCHNQTTGKACDQCIPGFYGDPTDVEGCMPCICNGHGDASQGTCNNTGQCYCIDNTQGDQCDTCKSGFYGNPRNGGKCYLQCDHRVYMTNITDGALGVFQGFNLAGEEHVYCLWILSTLPYGHYPPPYSTDIAATIALTVEGVDFECGQDAVYVYDGIPSSRKINTKDHSKLLAAFCGRRSPMGYSNMVYAQSGILSVYFEGSFLRSRSHGFNASYAVYSCPDSCQSNQMCQDGRCVCKPGFWGQACTIPLCSANCSESLKEGRCQRSLCACNPDLLGQSGGRHPSDKNEPGLQLLTDFPQPSCSKVPEQRFPFHAARSEVMTVEEEEEDSYGPYPRAGHSLTTCGNGLIFLFGGYSLEHGILNDMWMYNTSSFTWTPIIPTTTSSPGPRYHHAAACINVLKTLYILGGFEAVDHQLNPKNSKSLWKFNTESHAWSYHDTPSGLPPMAGHTLTYAGATILMVIGGFSSENYFNDKVFEYNASNGLMAWREFSVSTMRGAFPIGLYGHSAVYDRTTHTIYIYGGYLFHEDEWTVSSSLYSLDVEKKAWNILFPEAPQRATWEPRVFHAATHTDEGMVVIGGLTRSGTLAMDMLVYRYVCNTWHRMQFEDVELEQKTISGLGLRAVSVGNVTYAFGGFNGVAVGSLTKVTLPKDICALILDPTVCRNTSGCQTCTYVLETGKNTTVCYNSHDPQHARPPGCVGPHPWEKRCDSVNHGRRPCQVFPSCSTCLSVHPHFKEAGRRCYWCSNCKSSVCMSDKDPCPSRNCKQNEFPIQSVSHCSEFTCPASDCVRCKKLDSCLWSRHFKRSSEMKLFVNSMPVFNWNCISTNQKLSNPDELRSLSPNGCPMRCSEHGSCKRCLDSYGSEGGSKSCLWSEVLRECMAPAYIPLRCSLGECGYLYKGNSNSCPLPCQELEKCSDCIKSKACGWNAFQGKNGQGNCLPGSMSGQEKWGIQELYTMYLDQGVPLKVTGEDSSPSEDRLWSYDKCQPENECLNEHDTCDPDTEECIDTLKHFRCQCKHGYIRDKASSKCEPVCHQGCVHGTCVQMDECDCHFGWVGSNCSVECQCNKHSYCQDIYHGNNCTSCQNNTKGPRCQYCKRMFVGNPVNGGYCEPCKDFCHGHTKTCMTQREYELLLVKEISHQYGNNSYPRQGPSRASAVCFKCEHNTTGPQCDRCTSGHFRKHNEPKTNPCRACHCNGHSNVCNADTGENCKCKNNTETNCDSKDELECWEHQCAHCKEYFLGKPTNGHQCYRQMNVDRDYCFDPDTQNNCNQYPQALRPGRTVFFAVQPKYLNVDIRVTIDVTMGAADIFLSNKKDTFQVFLNQQDWYHDILIDKMYTSNGASLARRSLEGGRGGHSLDLSSMGHRDHANITVSDDPTASGGGDNEAILITDKVPDFLRIQRSDPAYYKLTQFKNIDELDRAVAEEKLEEGEEEPHMEANLAEALAEAGSAGKVVLAQTQAEPKAWKKKKKRPWHKHHRRTLDILRERHDSEKDSEKDLQDAHVKAKYLMDTGTQGYDNYKDRLFRQTKRSFTRWLNQYKTRLQKTPSYGVRGKHLRQPQEGRGKGQRRLRRGVTVTDSRSDKSALYNGQVKVGEIDAGALNTYITVNQENSVLVVRNVRFRLVITLPRDQHDLKSSRFYIIVRSRGGKGNNSTYGNLYFRQDQPHIDLFVFFSVFFSCFFLFLALCVMFWKLRQSFDARRSRQMREREMECMASRPFAKILVLLEPDGPVPPTLSTGLMRRRSRLNRIPNRNPYTTNIDINTMTILPPMKDLGVVPIAIEPTDDSLAAVATVLFQLPGGATTHSHLCLGSSLTTRMVAVPSSQKGANLRRRTSASSC